MREDFASDAIGVGKFFERFADGRDPVGRGPDVVVGKGDDVRASGGDTPVTSVRYALFFFEEVGEFFEAWFRAELFDDVASVVSGVVIDDDDLVRSIALLLDQTFERPRQDLRTIVRSYDYRNLRLCHIFLPRKSTKTQNVFRLTAYTSLCFLCLFVAAIRFYRGVGSGGRYRACKMCRASGDRNLFVAPHNDDASQCRRRTAPDGV